MPTVQTYTGAKGTTYRVRGRDGFGRLTTETFPTKKEASAFARLVELTSFAEAQADRARVDLASGSSYVPTLAEWVPQHIAGLSGVEARTRADYASLAKRTFLPHLGAKRMDEIDRPMVTGLVNALEAKGLSAKSIKNAHGLLSAVFASAMAERHIDWNPCYRVRLPRAKEHLKRSERFLTHEEYERLIAAIPADYVPLVVTMFGTGLRWSEATALTVGDFTAAQPPSIHNALGMPATLNIVKAWKMTPNQGWHVGPPKSSKSRRKVMLPTQVVDVIAPLLVDKRPTDLVFTAPRGGMIYHGWFRSRVWVPACMAAGLATTRPDRKADPEGWAAWTYDGPRIHDARHTHASWLLEQPLVSLEMVQDQLGHESIVTTRSIYGALQPAMRNALAQAATASMRAASHHVLEGATKGPDDDDGTAMLALPVG